LARDFPIWGKVVHIFADFADYPFATSDPAGRGNGPLDGKSMQK
jgi:hypothetical protein